MVALNLGKIFPHGKNRVALNLGKLEFAASLVTYCNLSFT